MIHEPDLRAADILRVLPALGGVVIQLSRLLRMRFVPGRSGGNSFLNEEIGKVLLYHNRGEYDFRDLQLMKLTMFVKHLLEIERHDKSLLKAFAKEFRRRQEREQYVGLRFEVDVAASLIRRAIPFERGESPDFRLEWDRQPVAIECTSAMLPIPREGDVAYKVTTTIANKGAAPYARPNTALFIDITDVAHRANLSGRPLMGSEIVDAVQAGLARCRFGAVVVFFHVLSVHEDRLRSRFESQFLSEIGVNCAPALKDFIETVFPTTRVSKPDVRRQAIPRAG